MAVRLTETAINRAIREVAERVKELRDLRNGPERNSERTRKLEEEVDQYRSSALAAWHVRSCVAGEVRPDERAHAGRLVAS